MKQLASTLSRQCGIEYEFGPEFKEYLEKKASETLGESHLKPLSEVFTEEQLRSIPVHNKAGENYFGHMSEQLRSKGGSAFKAISDGLVLKSSSNPAFRKDAVNMLKSKEMKSKQQEINKVEADWSSAQKEIMKSKLSLSDAETDKLAREQSKNKLLAQCVENGRKHKYIAPLSS